VRHLQRVVGVAVEQGHRDGFEELGFAFGRTQRTQKLAQGRNALEIQRVAPDDLSVGPAGGPAAFALPVAGPQVEQLKPEAAQISIDVREQRLILVNRRELDLGFHA
jgi:hypothetical protein